MSSSPHKVTRWSVTPLSTNDRDVEAGPSSDSMAAGSARASGGSEAYSLHPFSPDRLKMSPSMMTAAAQLLISSTHTLLDCPNKSLQKTADPSNDKATLECTVSFDNEGQMASLQEDDLEDDDIDFLIDPGDSATQVEREAAVAKIRPSVWVQDAADVKRIKQKQMPLGRVSESVIFNLFNPKQILKNILDLIVSRLSTTVFTDHCTTAPYQLNLDLPHIKHMYLKFKYAYVIQLCCTSVNFSIPQLFTGVLTPHTIKKHTIPGVMAKSRGDRTKSKEYKAVLCNFCPYFCGNEDSTYSHVCHLHLCMALGCGRCFDFVSFSQADLREHFKICFTESFDSGLAAGLD